MSSAATLPHATLTLATKDRPQEFTKEALIEELRAKLLEGTTVVRRAVE